MILPTIFTLLALAALGWAVRLREGPYRSARREPVALRCVVPQGVDPSLAAEALGVPARALAAELLDLAITGFLRIVTTETGSSGGRPRSAYGVQLRKTDWSSSDAQQASLLRALFGDDPPAGATVALYQYDLALSTRLDARRAALAGRIRELGYRDDRYRWLRADLTPFWVYLATALVVVVSLVHVFVLMTRDVIAWAAAGVDLLAMLVAIGALLLMVPRPIVTKKGARLDADLGGIRAYLAGTEDERLRTLASTHDASPGDDRSAALAADEGLLPYAVLFGAHADWAAVLQQAYATAGEDPGWFGAEFSPAALTSFTRAVSLSSLSGFYATGSIRGNLSGGGAAGGAGGR